MGVYDFKYLNLNEKIFNPRSFFIPNCSFWCAQNAPVINARLAMVLRKERPKPHHLIFAQPVKIAHRAPKFGSLNHAGISASSKLMGLEPNRS